MSTTRAAGATYNPARLLDALRGKLQLKNDAALARALDMPAPSISHIRHQRKPVGAALLVRASEATELPVRELRALMGDRRERFHPLGMGRAAKAAA